MPKIDWIIERIKEYSNKVIMRNRISLLCNFSYFFPVQVSTRSFKIVNLYFPEFLQPYRLRTSSDSFLLCGSFSSFFPGRLGRAHSSVMVSCWNNNSIMTNVFVRTFNGAQFGSLLWEKWNIKYRIGNFS